MHHLSTLSRRKAPSLEWSKDVKSLVSSSRCFRIKPHAPPACGGPLQFLEFQPIASYSPGGVLLMRCSALKGKSLQHYIIVTRVDYLQVSTCLLPHAFDPSGVRLQPRDPFANWCPHISTHFHRHTWNSHSFLSCALKSPMFQYPRPVKPGAFTSDLRNRAPRALRPINPPGTIRLHNLRITRPCLLAFVS